MRKQCGQSRLQNAEYTWDFIGEDLFSPVSVTANSWSHFLVMKPHILQHYLFCSTANCTHKSWAWQEQFYQPVNAGKFGFSGFFKHVFRTFNSDLLTNAIKSYLALCSTLNLTRCMFNLYIQIKSIKSNFNTVSSSASQKIAKWWLSFFTSDQSACQASHLGSLPHVGLSLHIILESMCLNKNRHITSASSYRPWGFLKQWMKKLREA